MHQITATELHTTYNARHIPIGSSTKLAAVFVNDDYDVIVVFPRSEKVYIYPTVPQDQVDEFLKVCEASLVDSETNSVGIAFNTFIATATQPYKDLGKLNGE
jgi:hypothetical protein